MSRAFVKENENEPILLPDRPVSPYPNYVTAAGRTALETALQRFEAAYRAAVAKGDALAAANDLREMRYWTARLSSAQIMKEPDDHSQVHFGARVTLRLDDGSQRTFRIVGEDEANPSSGTISHAAPIARAVMGHEEGETVEFAGHEAVILKIH